MRLPAAATRRGPRMAAVSDPPRATPPARAGQQGEGRRVTGGRGRRIATDHRRARGPAHPNVPLNTPPGPWVQTSLQTRGDWAAYGAPKRRPRARTRSQGGELSGSEPVREREMLRPARRLARVRNVPEYVLLGAAAWRGSGTSPSARFSARGADGSRGSGRSPSARSSARRDSRRAGALDSPELSTRRSSRLAGVGARRPVFRGRAAALPKDRSAGRSSCRCPSGRRRGPERGRRAGPRSR
jgi:hypothetical protein